jgi:hypothetical protein
MEGGVMLARTTRDLAPFDAVVATLRTYLDALIADASRRRGAGAKRRRSST